MKKIGWALGFIVSLPFKILLVLFLFCLLGGSALAEWWAPVEEAFKAGFKWFPGDPK